MHACGGLPMVGHLRPLGLQQAAVSDALCCSDTASWASCTYPDVTAGLTTMLWNGGQASLENLNEETNIHDPIHATLLTIICLNNATNVNTSTS